MQNFYNVNQTTNISRRVSTMKKALSVAISAAMLAGCFGAMTAQAEETYKVAYIARAQEDSFAAWLADEIRASFDEYDDMEVEVFDGQANDEVKNSIIET